ANVAEKLAGCGAPLGSAVRLARGEARGAAGSPPGVGRAVAAVGVGAGGGATAAGAGGGTVAPFSTATFPRSATSTTGLEVSLPLSAPASGPRPSQAVAAPAIRTAAATSGHQRRRRWRAGLESSMATEMPAGTTTGAPG